MMTLKDLIQGIYPGELPEDLATREICAITSDSRQVVPHSLFVALSGTLRHGGEFIEEALQKGASVIVTDRRLRPNTHPGVFFLSIADPRTFLKEILIRWYGRPSRNVKTIGITGTNGKTTITYLLESIFAQAGRRLGVIGTVNYRIGPKILPSKNTTPGLVENCLYLSELQRSQVDYCVMEVSSHALSQGRVDLIDFEAGIFTNLTGDHLDYHRDMENYFEAKSRLFTRLSRQSTAVINSDCPFGRRLKKMTPARLITYGLEESADFSAEGIDLQLTHSSFTLTYDGHKQGMRTKLIGRHNIYNILAAAAAAFSQGISLDCVAQGVERLDSVPGRLEAVACGQHFPVFVDYAHTEDALRNVLEALKGVEGAAPLIRFAFAKRIKTTGPPQIILVFGCGGNRDQSKRPQMGQVACQLADWVIVTSDNPRQEDPQAIIDQIIQGCPPDRYEVLLDREEAIRKALSLAGPNDIVLIAGKGHETTQIFKDRTIPFDDREVVRNYFAHSSLAVNQG